MGRRPKGNVITAKHERFAAWSDLLSPPHAETRSVAWRARIGGLIAILGLLSYVTWRVTSTIPDHGAARAVGLLLLTFETVPIIPLCLRLFTLWSLDATPPPRAGVDEVYGPAVVFVPTYNEPASVLGPTVAAACQLKPAHETWVLDDGDRPWVREMCETYGARYVQRAVHDHAKAGNINHALALMNAEGHEAEFIAILDCDHVPLEGFLYETLGWFDDPNIALVQAPQAYFNEAAFDGDGFAGEQGIFFHALMIARSGPKADPPWCGSTSVVRRTAIDQVGGIATETITEDLHTTLKLLRLGWRTVYHHQVLAVGLAPDTPEQYLIQRRRWALGAMQVVVAEKLLVPKRWLTRRNQMEYLLAAFWWFEGAITAGSMIVPAIVLISGVQPVRADPWVYGALVTGQILLRMVGANQLYRGYTRWRHALELRVLRIPIGLQSMWWLVTRRELAFQVTPKDATDERRFARVPAVLWWLAIAVGAVLAYGASSLLLPMPWRTSAAATIIGSVWLLWGLIVLLMGIARIRDPDFRTTRRVAHRFNVSATVRVDGVPGRLRNVSTTGLAVSFDGPAPGGDVEIVLPGSRPVRMRSVRTQDGVGTYDAGAGNFEAIRVLAGWIFLTPPDPGHDVPPGLPAAAVMGDSIGAAPEPPHRSTRRNDIQGLRALAVALVVLAHLGIVRLAGGFIGVDVFFVISGFLITGLMLRDFTHERRISLRAFYARRAQRILPAAILVSAAVLIATGLTQASLRVSQYRSDALWSAGFLENLHLIRQATDYFADTAVSPFQHFWSLSVEEQFYVVWPLLLILLLRALSRETVLAVVSAVVVLSVGASISLTHSHPQQAYFSTYTRAFELGLGAILAIAVLIGMRVSSWFAWIGGAVGAAVIVWAGLTMSQDGFPGWHALIPTVATVVLIAAGIRRQVGVNWLLGLAPLRWLGDISYSLYLWHFPVIVLGRPLLPSDWSDWQGNVLLVLISLAAADLTYRLVERPLLRRQHTSFRGLRPLVWWPVAASTVFAVAFASSAYAEHRQARIEADAAGWYASHASACPDGTMDAAKRASVAEVSAELDCAHQLASLGAPVPPGVTASAMSDDGFAGGAFCWDHVKTESIIACASDQRDTRPSLVLLGDSHMGQWLPAFQRIAEQRGYNFVPYVKPGCPIWDLETFTGGSNGNDPACGAYRSASLKSIGELHPALVVMTSIIDKRAASGGNAIGDGWRRGVEATLPQLAGLDTKVVVLGDTPLRDGSVPNCIGSPGNGIADCELVRPPQSAKLADWLHQQVSAAGLTWLDPVPLVCRDSSCPAVAAGIGMYSDASHITRTWSTHIATALEELLDDAHAFEG